MSVCVYVAKWLGLTSIGRGRQVAEARASNSDKVVRNVTSNHNYTEQYLDAISVVNTIWIKYENFTEKNNKTSDFKHKRLRQKLQNYGDDT